MKFQYNLQDPNFRVGNIDVQVVSRPKNYKHSFRNGREKHGFIYIVSGKMLDTGGSFCYNDRIIGKEELFLKQSICP